MFKKTVTYTDYNGVEKTEDFWFNLNKQELISIAAAPSGGLETMLKDIIQASDMETIIETFKKIILMAYGRKMPDGTFTKKDKNGRLLSEWFSETAVFPDMFLEIAFDSDKAIDFINGCVPPDMHDALKDKMGEAKAKISQLAPNQIPAL